MDNLSEQRFAFHERAKLKVGMPHISMLIGSFGMVFKTCGWLYERLNIFYKYTSSALKL
jgi:hypothetical protein